MKNNIKHYSKLFAALVFLGSILSSCTKDSFLDETLTTQRDNTFFETEEGIIQLAVGANQRSLAAIFQGEEQFATTNYGTDEFHVGGDATNSSWNNYDATFGPIVQTTRTQAEHAWDRYWIAIGMTNQLIQAATNIESSNPAVKQVALGEGYFLRAYNYLKLVRQYGGVPLKLEPSNTLELEFARASAEEVLAQIIDDLNQAYNLLDNSRQAPVNITRDAVAHYLAKAHLTRASEINDAWNGDTKAADLARVIQLSDEVIANHPLASNFQELWRFTQPDDDSEFLPELILSAQFTKATHASYSNFNHVAFTARYDDMTTMKRDLTGMRPYSRLAATYFTYDVYDKVNDSRFWKTFRTKHRVNRGGEFDGIEYIPGVDLGIMYIINSPDDTRFANTRNNNDPGILYNGKPIPHVYVAHANDGVGLFAEPRFPSLTKHFDSSRNSINDNRGMRDEILARSAETYLMAAEAHIRLGNYAQALPYINDVRNRATYKAGEDRAYYEDGAEAYPTSDFSQPFEDNSYMNENSYYESNGIPVTTAATDLTVTDIANLPAEDEAIIATLGYGGDYDRMMCFLLNERSRELMGEWHRWEDLSRTLTLVARAREYNPEASPNIQDFHVLRPIPQTHIDAVYNSEGTPLTPEQKDAMQNPGY
ncbi:RagB/SusD family nutrient uptake outer membrane protein [Muricauda sp. CAU 1633]|uniref:RagB/SusD family nutrient uptake outer membrane protein n=1 Tax=Allomuricauda sp. CAU 1633 TaxID=2816036 RepID=UPI001A8D414B|nr:RagB/SusD family nutrient uptake outer membrane protein [Muricauda sp. CAU 1633]MBO0324073.1 RagB/SusD family nutrient uptake outer membrane protein [Muricauda sp. CAU 1633]